MNLSVEYIDATGNCINRIYDLTYPAFIKHYAFCGLGAGYSLEKFFRFFGALVEFNLYWDNNNSASR